MDLSVANKPQVSVPLLKEHRQTFLLTTDGIQGQVSVPTDVLRLLLLFIINVYMNTHGQNHLFDAINPKSYNR